MRFLESPRARAISPHATPLGLALAVTALVHLAALRTFFAQDDITFLACATRPLASLGPVRFLSTTLAFRLEHALFGLDPLGYHVVNLLLHLANVAGVYLLGLRLIGGRGRATAAAILFGASSIAFTPLHWASGIIELLAAGLLVMATLVLFGPPVRMARQWFLAFVLLAALSAKEIAVAWIAFAALARWMIDRTPPHRAIGVPALAVGVAFPVWFLVRGTGLDLSRSGAYALSASPDLLLSNLSTYVLWCVALWNPIRDAMATIDLHAWRVAIPVAALFGMSLTATPSEGRKGALLALAWWLAFLLPVLPLAHHSYLYYLYIPWIGGSIAVVSVVSTALSRLAPKQAGIVGALLVASFAAVEGRNVLERRSASRDHLPVDRTIRDSELLRHALLGLRAADLAPGTKIGFVNPLPRAAMKVETPDPSEGSLHRESYIPLEAALRGGEAIQLFLPTLEYMGFATTVPVAWTDVECFYYEQRGWLEPWGKGETALIRQAELQRVSTPRE